MRRVALLSILLFVCTACGRTLPATRGPEDLASPATADLQTADTGDTTATLPPEPTQPAEAVEAAVVRYTDGSLWVDILDLPDGKVVDTADIVVSGMAPAETVISLNEDFIVVGTDQTFNVPISLEEGPNVLEIVASDPEGNEVDIVLTVVYEAP